MVYHIFCDESRQTKDRFMVLGGLIIPQGIMDTVNDTLQQFREEEDMRAELKWTKITDKMLRKYLRFVDYFFALNNNNKIHFHSIIIDNSQVNHRKFSEGDREVGFYKFYYQLLLNCFGKHYAVNRKANSEESLIVHLDQRASSYPLHRLQDILNNGMAKKHGVHHRPFRSIEPVDSKKSDLMQVVDIIVGAIGFQKNGVHLLAGTRASKIAVADHIAKQAGLSSLADNTKYDWNQFKIWNFRLSK